MTPWACPMKILEYMAAGRAIVAPGSDNVRELLADGATALLCPAGENPAMPETIDLQAAVLRLARDPGLRRRLGGAARRQVEDAGLYWEENARRVEELVMSARDVQGTAAVVRTREVTTC